MLTTDAWKSVGTRAPPGKGARLKVAFANDSRTRYGVGFGGFN